MFTISIKTVNDYFTQQYTQPTTVSDIKKAILADPKGKGFYYDNLVLLNYHSEKLKDDYHITETTVFTLVIKPMTCDVHLPADQ